MIIRMTTTRSNNTYFKNLCKNLEAMGLSYEEVSKDYKYSGGTKDRHSNYFKLCFVNTHYPDRVSQCLCEHEIKENCYISKGNDFSTIIILGNCCIKKFIKSSSRTCEICSAIHQNRNNNYCNDCKLIYNKCKDCKKQIKPCFKKCFNCKFK